MGGVSAGEVAHDCFSLREKNIFSAVGSSKNIARCSRVFYLGVPRKKSFIRRETVVHKKRNHRL